jgi:hypothetical protein
MLSKNDIEYNKYIVIKNFGLLDNMNKRGDLILEIDDTL